MYYCAVCWWAIFWNEFRVSESWKVLLFWSFQKVCSPPTLNILFRNKQLDFSSIKVNMKANCIIITYKTLISSNRFMENKIKRWSSIKFGLWPFPFYVPSFFLSFFFLPFSFLLHAPRATSRQWNPKHKWRGCVWSWPQADGAIVFGEKRNAHSENEPLRNSATLVCILVRWWHFQGSKKFVAPSKPVTAPGRVSR